MNLSFKLTTWNFLYLGAVLCGLISVATVYQITITRNTSNEWIVWICVVLGYVYESRYKREHPKEDQAKTNI